jgi:hypothetical protein
MLPFLPYRFRSGTVLELETVALRHQLNVPRRQSFRRPQLSSIDGLLWVRRENRVHRRTGFVCR